LLVEGQDICQQKELQENDRQNSDDPKHERDRAYQLTRLAQQAVKSQDNRQRQHVLDDDEPVIQRAEWFAPRKEEDEQSDLND